MADECLECKLGFRLSMNKKECKPNPTGVRNCYKHKNINECEICDKGMIL